MIRKIQGILTALWYRLTSPPYRLLKNSMLFDRSYYLEHNRDVAALGMDPLVHYLTRGFAEQRSPGPLFDRRYYSHQVPGLDETADNPLLHFLRSGRHQGLRPNLLVDPAYYAHFTPASVGSGLDPLSHFLRKGERDNRSPSPYFDPAFYCGKYPDAAPHAHDPVAAYRHFLRIGLVEKRQPSAFFDTAWYLDKTPILHDQGLDPISHYQMFGIAEGKSPCPLFDPKFYESICDTEGEKDLFAHYLRHEPAKDLRPCAWFDPVFYRQKYLAAGTPQDSPLKHYLQQGVHERAYPNRAVAELAEKPLISVVVPVYNVVLAHLNNCIRSVLYQSYPHWELCLADDCSTDAKIRPLLEQWSAVDSRIKIAFLAENRGISAATNAAAALATGRFLAFLDNDDELAPEALFAFVRAMAGHGGDLFYSDEDLIGDDGTRFSVFRKPGFNRELLLCHNYVTHCVMAEKALFDRVGGCDSAMNGAQDHDLFLKLAEQAGRITHVPEILYHWRASESSTSINHSQKEYANEAGRKSVAGALARLGIAGTARCTDLKFFYRAERLLPKECTVAILVHWRKPIDEFKPWLSRLVATAGAAIGQLVVAVESSEWVDSARQTCAEAAVDTNCLVVPGVSETAAAYNGALEHIRSEFVVLADSLLESTGDGWLAALLEYCSHAGIGLVGGRVDYPSALGNPSEVTPIADYSIASPAYYARFLANCSVLMNGLHCPQEVRSMTGELCLIRTAMLREAGGFNAADFPWLFFVQDLALRLHLQGKTHIYTPYCTSLSTSQPNDHEPRLALEKTRFQQRWSHLLSQGDPFYNTGLLTDRRLSVAAFQAWLTGSSASPHDSIRHPTRGV